MWKIIVLLCSYIAVQASEIEPFYGKWTQVALYPISGYVPTCIQFVFGKDSRNIDCNCADGKSAPLVELALLIKQGKRNIKAPVDSYPMIVVDSPEDVDIDVECTCGERHYQYRTVLRSVSPNYFLMYEKTKLRNYTEADPNDAYVFAKKVPTLADLMAVLESIEDLKNRRGSGMCAKNANLELNSGLYI